MKSTSLMLLFLLTLASCLPNMNPSKLAFEEHKPTFKPQEQEEISYELLREKVLDAKCLGCHKRWKDEFSFQSKHVVLGDPDRSKMFDAVKSGRMPVGEKLPDGTRAEAPDLSTEELEYFYGYIKHAKPASKPETQTGEH